MKSQRILVAGLLAAVLSAGFTLARADTEAKAGAAERVEIVFDHPEKFADIKDSSMDTEKGRQAIMDEIKEYVVMRAKKLLPEGARLSITFTDIDLAGDYEPWRVGTNSDVRVVKDIYPPSFVFSYKVTAADGTVLKEGTENLRDLNFMSRLVINRSDPLRFEKDMLDDWLRSHLRSAGK